MSLSKRHSIHRTKMETTITKEGILEEVKKWKDENITELIEDLKTIRSKLVGTTIANSLNEGLYHAVTELVPTNLVERYTHDCVEVNVVKITRNKHFSIMKSLGLNAEKGYIYYVPLPNPNKMYKTLNIPFITINNNGNIQHSDDLDDGWCGLILDEKLNYNTNVMFDPPSNVDLTL